MQYPFERVRFHFVEHAVRQIWQDGNAATIVIESLQQELEQAPLQAAQNQGIAQFKYGKQIQSIEYDQKQA